MKQHVLAVIVISLSLAGCCSRSSDKPTLERGWIGGEFKTTRHELPAEAPRAKVYVKQLYPGTPAEQAGLKPGDLIVRIDERAVENLREFRSIIDAASPGTRPTVQVWRAGELLELPVTIGRESYHQWHAIQVGVHLSSKLDVLPDPNFSLAPLARYERVQDRVELNSPEMMLSQYGKDTAGERGVHSREGWHMWFLIFGADAHKRILKQEVAPASTGARPVTRAAINTRKELGAGYAALLAGSDSCAAD